MDTPIIKKNVRILRPSEYELLKTAMDKKHKAMADGLLLTGLRYIEAEKLQLNPEWWEGWSGGDRMKFINLPPDASEKAKASYTERSVRLSSMGIKAMSDFLIEDAKLPTRGGWDWLMKKWATEAGLDERGMCAKTTRKTWESWLGFYYPTKMIMIAQSQGHTTMTQMEHYLNMPFYPEEKTDMAKYLKGWA